MFPPIPRIRRSATPRAKVGAPVFLSTSPLTKRPAEGAFERAAPSFISRSWGVTAMRLGFFNLAHSHLSCRRRIA